MVVVATLATVVTAVVAIWSLVGARRDSADRSRPSVTPEFRLVQSPRLQCIALVVTNRGPTPAREVKVDFDPPLEEGPSGNLSDVIAQRYAKPVPTLAPGLELSNIWHAITLADAPYSDEPTDNPRRVKVTIGYQGSKRKRWTDVYPLDLDVLLAETSMSTDPPDPTPHLATIAKHLRVVAVCLAAQAERRDAGDSVPTSRPPSP